MCDFPGPPLAQAPHLEDTSHAEQQQKKYITQFAARHGGRYCLYRSVSIRAQAQPVCSISSTEPSSDRNTSRMGMGWIKELLTQAWILSRQPAATFWHSKLSQMLPKNSYDSLSPGQSAGVGSVWLSPLMRVQTKQVPQCLRCCCQAAGYMVSGSCWRSCPVPGWCAA